MTRIQEIIAQMNRRREDLWIEDDKIEFAEIIIRECVDVCNRIYFQNYPNAQDFEHSEEGDAIKKHFGVK